MGAEGVSLGRTLVVMDGGETEATIEVRNSLRMPVLVQTKVLDLSGQPSALFVTLPPLYRLDSNQNNRVRLRLTQLPPQDKESVYKVSVISVPSGKTEGNAIKVLLEQRIQLFYRPKSIKDTSYTAAQALEWSVNGGWLRVDNPSLVSVAVPWVEIGGRKEKGRLLLPHGFFQWKLPESGKKLESFSFTYVNEHGALDTIHKELQENDRS